MASSSGLRYEDVLLMFRIRLWPGPLLEWGVFGMRYALVLLHLSALPRRSMLKRAIYLYPAAAAAKVLPSANLGLV